MVASDYRAKARENLSGKWGKAALIMVCFFAYSLIFSYLNKHTSGILNISISVLSLVINIPIAYGVSMAFLKLYNNEEVKSFDFFTLGITNFSRAWKVAFSIFLKILLPFILIIVSYILIGGGIFAASASRSSSSFGALALIGFILLIVSSIWLTLKSYSYSLAQYIAIENPNMTGKEAVNKSEQLMNKKRWKLFCLQFSFIGWAILSCSTFGIGMLWLIPYTLFATIAFYKNASTNEGSAIQ